VLRTQVETVVSGAAADRAFVEGTYKSVLANRLKGKKIAVLLIGSSEKVRRTAIVMALADAGAGPPLRIRFVKVPVDPDVLAQKLAKKPLLAITPDSISSRTLATTWGWSSWRDGHAVVECIAERARRGEDRPGETAADGVVIVRIGDATDRADSLFLKGLYAGLATLAFLQSAWRLRVMRPAPSRRSSGQVSRPSTTSDTGLGSSRCCLARRSEFDRQLRNEKDCAGFAAAHRSAACDGGWMNR